jgi:hypothetical protein
MIDLTNEQLVPIRQVPARLPLRPNGKKLHISAVYRWINGGLKGVRLETTKVGGTTYTSLEALHRFADRLDGTLPLAHRSISRQRQVNQAARRVNAIYGRADKEDHVQHDSD